jgi:Domain of unknown function (DUF4279)
MRIRQRAYLRLSSADLPPQAISDLLGIAPSESRANGSRQPGPPPLPRANLWHLESGISDQAPVGDHLAALWPKLLEVEDGLRTFLTLDGSKSWLQIVRYFEDGNEDFDESTWDLPDNATYKRIGGQHPFLGFRLDGVQLQFLASLGLEVDIDEYG